MKDENSLPEHVLGASVDFINFFTVSNDNFVSTLIRKNSPY